ncbi:hypothetical protein GOV11_03770 [Candidatus Woesearchaeota archaeon]|nr:hypothetical protein [Candidatus Woesearchaeota archaeon]
MRGFGKRLGALSSLALLVAAPVFAERFNADGDAIKSDKNDLITWKMGENPPNTPPPETSSELIANNWRAMSMGMQEKVKRYNTGIAICDSQPRGTDYARESASLWCKNTPIGLPLKGGHIRTSWARMCEDDTKPWVMYNCKSPDCVRGSEVFQLEGDKIMLLFENNPVGQGRTMRSFKNFYWIPKHAKHKERWFVSMDMQYFDANTGNPVKQYSNIPATNEHIGPFDVTTTEGRTGLERSVNSFYEQDNFRVPKEWHTTMPERLGKKDAQVFVSGYAGAWSEFTKGQTCLSAGKIADCYKFTEIYLYLMRGSKDRTDPEKQTYGIVEGIGEGMVHWSAAYHSNKNDPPRRMRSWTATQIKKLQNPIQPPVYCLE